DRPVQQLANERLGGRVAEQRVQVALDDGGSRSFLHGEAHRRRRRMQGLLHFCVASPLTNSEDGNRALTRPDRLGEQPCHAVGGRRTWAASGQPSEGAMSDLLL